MRRSAERRLEGGASPAPSSKPMPDALRLMHELQVHQIELELQNEELRSTKEELELALDKYSNLYNFAPLGFFTLDYNGTVLEANRTGAHLLGIDPIKSGKPDFSTFVAPDSSHLLKKFLKKALDTGLKESIELPLLGRGGAIMHAQLEAVAEAGGTNCLVAVVDVANLKHIQGQLQQARDEAQAANRAKSVFLANMSHEIRTPMSGVIGMLQLLRATALDNTQRHYADLSATSASHLLRLIDDILDFSKLEAGKLEFESREYPPRQVIEESVSGLANLAKEKGISLSCKIEADVPEVMVGDRHRLRQVLVNLIGNAIKFTERGSVTVRAETADNEGGAAFLTVSVADTGIGIPESMRASLFESFRQLDDATARMHGGSGLGLAISKQLVEGMGGSIRLASAEGKGSVFTFTIPSFASRRSHLKAEPPLSARARVDDEAGSIRILVAEDEPVNREITAAYLSQRGWQVTEVADGLAALEKLKSGNFDLVFMDVQMPGMDGFEATRIFRCGEAPGGCRLPVVGLTAHALKGDREKCIDSGMDDYLTKPVEPEVLWAAVERWTGSPHLTGPPAPNREKDALKKIESRIGSEKFADLRSTLAADLKNGLKEIMDAIHAGKLDKVAFLAHRMHGALVVFGFLGTADIAQKMETLAVASRQEGLAPLAEQLQSEVELLQILLMNDSDT